VNKEGAEENGKKNSQEIEEIDEEEDE